jgi:hypothetical protein
MSYSLQKTSENKKEQLTNYSQAANKIYRFVLPTGANAYDRQEFQRNIEIVKQANPQWAVVTDWPQFGEEEAIVMIYKGDGNYLNRRAAYIVNKSLSEVLQGDYDKY